MVTLLANRQSFRLYKSRHIFWEEAVCGSLLSSLLLSSFSCVSVFGQSATQLCVCLDTDRTQLRKYWEVTKSWGTAAWDSTHLIALKSGGIGHNTDASATNGCRGWASFGLGPDVRSRVPNMKPTFCHI